jgi:hypothetical protein
LVEISVKRKLHLDLKTLFELLALTRQVHL